MSPRTAALLRYWVNFWIIAPLAITAFSGKFIESARLRDVKDIVTFTPGFSGNSADSYIDSLAIRGIVSNPE